MVASPFVHMMKNAVSFLALLVFIHFFSAVAAAIVVLLGGILQVLMGLSVE